MLSADDYKKLGEFFNKILKDLNYEVTQAAPNGKPGKVVRTQREYRLQLIDKSRDTSEELVKALPKLLTSASKDIKGIKFNSISPNSSKFPSYTFTYSNQEFDLVIARGANKGENFETQTVADLAKAFSTTKKDPSFASLIKLMNECNPEFANVEIKSVKQRTGSTKKEGVPIEKLGAIIGDIVLTDTNGKEWFISLKDSNGNTFSSYSGAASIFDSNGTLQPNSPGSEFLNSFGVDLNKVQEGFDLRNKKKDLRPKLKISRADPSKIKPIFERAWGMNYFYVRKMSSGWQVFWIDRNMLNKLAGNIRVTEIKYPSLSSKQISIFCENNTKKYLIELRNSKAQEYPNDTKFKVR